MGVGCFYKYPRAYGFRQTDIVDEAVENLPARTLLRLDHPARDWNATAEEYLNCTCILLSDPYFWNSIRFTTGSFHTFLIHAVAYGRASRTTKCVSVFRGWPFSSEKTIGDLIDLDAKTPLRMFHTNWDLFDEYDSLVTNDGNLFNMDWCTLEPAVEQFEYEEEEDEPQPMDLENEEDVSDHEEEADAVEPAPIAQAPEPVVVEPEPSPAVRIVDSELTVSTDRAPTIVESDISNLDRIMQPWVESYDPKEEARFNKEIQGSVDWNKFDSSPGKGDTVFVDENDFGIDFLFLVDAKFANRARVIPYSTSETGKHSPARFVYINSSTRRKALKRALLLYTAQHSGGRMSKEATFERVVNVILYARNEPFDAAIVTKVAEDYGKITKFKSKFVLALHEEYHNIDRKVRAKK